MRLRIEDSEGVVFILWLPTSLLKSKFIIKSIKKYGRIDDNEPFINSLPIIHKSLKEYIKKNGHFVLFYIESSDGDKISIKG